MSLIKSQDRLISSGQPLDSGADFTTIRVRSEVKRKLDDEQDRVRRESGNKPTLSAVIAEMLAARIAAIQAEPALDPDQQWHAMLDEILADPEERLGIEKSLRWGVAAVRTRRKEKKLVVGE